MSQLSQRQFQRWIQQTFAARVARPAVRAAGGRPMALEALDERVVPAAYTFPSDNTLFFQTSGRERPATIGDWYTTQTSASTDRVHRVSIEITAAQLAASGGSVTVTVNDGESTNGPGPVDEVDGNTTVGAGTGDPTRFRLLDTDGKSVLDSKVFASGSANGSNYTFTAITKAGVYTLTSETGGFPISGDTTADLNNDDNAFSVTVSDDGGAGNRGQIGFVQASFQQSTQATRSFNFLVGAGTPGLFLRNFDLDNGVGRVFYTDPTGKEYAGTFSNNGVWNGGGDLNSGGDTITGPLPAGFWTVTFENYTAGNQAIFEANTTDGTRLTVFDSAVLSGSVYIDANDDGARQTAELGISKAVVVLTGTDTLGNVLNVTTTTDTSGNYRFVGLNASNAAGYTLTETQPAGFLDGRDTAGSRGGSAAVNDTISGIVLGAGLAGDGYDFGELSPASLSGSVYIDANNDGVRQTAELGISKAIVVLTGTDDLGNAVSLTATTDGSGNYGFTGLRPSNVESSYTLTETQPGGFLDGKDAAGSAGGTVANDKVSGITLASGTAGAGYTFGELGPASLAGRVYFDRDSSGTQTAGDLGISKAVVVLSGTDDLGAAVSLTATTDANGDYSFTGLRPSGAAGYTLTETQPTGYLDGADNLGSLGGTPANDKFSAIAVASGASGTGYAFGELGPNVTGRVFIDLNRDGAVNGADAGRKGVVVVLTDGGGKGVATTTTDGSGDYSFGNVLPGTYTVVETVPGGFGTSTATTFAADASKGTSPVAVTPFGLTVSTIAGTVYRDDNNSGTFNAGDAPLSGVVVTLTDSKGAAVVDAFGNTVAAFTTGAAGTYSFANLLAGSYRVTEAQPAGLNSATNTVGSFGGPPTGSVSGDTFTVPAPAGQDGTGYNFGEVVAGDNTVSGYVYRDRDNNGLRAATGEPGIQLVVLTLSGLDQFGNAFTATATTDTSGFYSFTGVPPSDAAGYTITEAQPAGFFDGKDSSQGVVLAGSATTDFIGGIAVRTTGATFASYDFGELEPSSLAGAVFRDDDDSGAQNGGEPGIGGVIVTLSGTDDLAAAVSKTATTGASGAYNFAGLRPGTYTLTETQPAQFSDGKDALGSAGGTLGNDAASAIALLPNVAATGYTFGERGATLSGNVFVDLNRDGAINGADSGRTGVLVTLSGGTTTLTATTDGSGNYGFPNLPAGSYTLTEITPTGFGSSTTTTRTVTVPLGGSAGNNFGLTLSTIAGRVYLDANNSGGFDAADTPIGGVQVRLLDSAGKAAVDGFGNAVAAVTTGLDGTYTFSGVVGGSYQVVETQPANFGQGTNTVGGFGGTVAGDTFSVPVPAGQDGTNYNFGEVGGGVSGSVYRDANNNGLRDGGETGVQGVILNLVNGGGTVVASATTDANGNYSFSNLLPGTYTVVETAQPAGLLDGRETRGNVTPIAGSVGTDSIGGIVVTAGTGSAGNNFGELAPASVGDRVFTDSNGNGIQDPGELGLGGVVVRLTGVDDTGAVGRTATTDGSGSYGFAGLRPGTYTLEFAAPAGTRFTYQGRGGDPTKDSDASADTGLTSSFTLAVGQADTTKDAGLFTPVSIGQLVWLNNDGNGTQDPGEPGLPNVVVRLTQYGPDGLVGTADDIVTTTTTGPTGVYGFGNLAPGTFQVRVLSGLPGGTSPNFDADGGNDGSTVLTLSSGQTSATTNFGYAAAGTLGGIVWLNLNGNGTQDPGEPGLPGVSVRIREAGADGVLGNADDVLTGPVTTGPGGSYSFTGLPGGLYRVDVDPATLPPGATPNFDFDGAPFSTAVVEFPGTAAVTNINFGYAGAGAIGDTVFNDRNGSGTQDPGEPGLAGAVVTLTQAGADGVLGTADDFTFTPQTVGTSGQYLFTNLLPGSYRVTVNANPASPGLTVTGDPQGALDGVADVTLTPTAIINSTTDFGYRGPGVIGDRVWLDLNANGLQDTGEPGIAGAVVTLINLGADGKLGTADDLSEGTVTAGANGIYNFTGLPVGTYAVQVVGGLPAGLTTPTFDADGVATPNAATVSVTQASPVVTTADFGYRGTGSIGDRVFGDTNGNGLQDTGEPGIVGAVVTLTFAGIDGDFATTADNATLTTTTGPNGVYRFDNLPAGNFRVAVDPATVPAGLSPSSDADGIGTPNVALVTLAPAQTTDAVDFGYANLGTVTGVVFVDTNNNGTRDPGEPGLPGTVVVLTGTDLSGNSVIRTVTSGPDGSYSFPSLPPGSYTLTQTQPNGYGSSTPNSVPVTVPAGGSAVVNYGETTSNFAGTVYTDRDLSGSFNAADAPLPGVVVTLTGTDANGAPVALTATTGPDGRYSFAGLLAGTYAVTEAQPAGLFPGVGTVGSLGGTLTSPLANTVTGVAVGAGTSGTGYNFGEFAPATVNGAVYSDVNNNGVRNPGETGIAGVAITISGTAFPGTPAARPLVASDLPGNSLTVRTDAAGNFNFAGLPPGVYTITEAQPSGFFDGAEQNADAAGPNTVSVGNDFFGNVVTAPTGSRGAFNFGEVPPSGVSGKVYVDTNTNGRQDPGEPSVPGVLVTLTGTDDRGSPVTATVTTGPDGSYSVGGLRPGSYSVRFTPPSGSLVFGPEALNGVAVTPGNPVGNLNFAVRPAVRNVPLNPATQTPLPTGTTATGMDPTKREFLGSTDMGRTTAPADFSRLPRSPQFVNAANVVGRTDGKTTPIAVATGADSGSEPRVRVFDFAAGRELANCLAYESTFTGGVRVAVADLNGDGTPEVITAPGIGGGPLVKVFDLSGNLLRQFLVYEESYRGGLWVAAGDTDGDGRAEIVTGADIGGGPRVRVIDGLTGAGKADFFAYESGFRGGVRVAVGDLDGDGRAEIVTGAGVGGGPIVRVFDGAGNALRSFEAFESSFRGGVAVAIGDLDGSGRAQIITTAGFGGGPRVLATDGITLAPVQTFFAFDENFRGGLKIATADINADGRADLVIGTGTGGGGRVIIRDAKTGTVLDDFYAADPALRGGINVG